MIREKKDLAKAVAGASNSISIGKEGKESSPDNQVQYEVTYVGTAQQVELKTQNLEMFLVWSVDLCYNPTMFLRRWE